MICSSVCVICVHDLFFLYLIPILPFVPTFEKFSCRAESTVFTSWGEKKCALTQYVYDKKKTHKIGASETLGKSDVRYEAVVANLSDVHQFCSVFVMTDLAEKVYEEHFAQSPVWNCPERFKII